MPRARRLPTTDRPIADLPGLGPRTAAWLADVGIETESQLREIGAVDAYRCLKHLNERRVSLNMLWGLHAALTGMPWTMIDGATKQRLKREAGAN